MTAEHPHEITVDVGKARITLDQLGLVQPGMARLMAEVGPRVHRLYYAAEAGNWPLARYFLNETRKILQAGVVVRPRYADGMGAFLAEDVPPVVEAITARDWAAFETAYARMVDAANRYHGVYGKGWLRWRTPDAPPPDLDLAPRPADEE